jgi:hypothetical protein
MLIAWAFLAPTAWLIKRHQDGVNYLTGGTVKIFGYPLPFLLHGSFMLTAVFLTIVGGSIALITFPRRAMSGHLPIGYTVIAVAIFQPFPALFCRPEHDSPRRKYFNWVHKAGGATALILGPINVFLGCLNYRFLWDNCGVAQWYTLASIGVGLAVLAALFAECGSAWFWFRRQGQGASTHHELSNEVTNLRGPSDATLIAQAATEDGGTKGNKFTNEHTSGVDDDALRSKAATTIQSKVRGKSGRRRASALRQQARDARKEKIDAQRGEASQDAAKHEHNTNADVDAQAPFALA